MRDPIKIVEVVGMQLAEWYRTLMSGTHPVTHVLYDGTAVPQW